MRTVVLPYWNALSLLHHLRQRRRLRPDARRSPLQSPSGPSSIAGSSRCSQSLVRDVNREMEGYRLYNVVPRLIAFIDDLTNWYIRRSRRRFWKSDDDADKADAYATLYEVLVTFAKVLAPFMPFFTETSTNTSSAISISRPPRACTFATTPRPKPVASTRHSKSAWPSSGRSWGWVANCVTIRSSRCASRSRHSPW